MSRNLQRAGRIVAAAPLALAGGWALFVARRWLAYGQAASPGARRDELLDRFLPGCEVAERHEIQVAAPATVTYAAARELDIHRSKLVRALFRGRELLMFERGEPRVPRSLLAETLSLGWGVLAEVPDREIVVGALARPWQADPEFRSLPPEDFAAFHEPGWVKIAWTLSTEARGASSSVFRTETRVATTDPHSRACFRRYWSVFSPGILLIRRATLRLVKEDAERRWRRASPRERAG